MFSIIHAKKIMFLNIPENGIGVSLNIQALPAQSRHTQDDHDVVLSALTLYNNVWARARHTKGGCAGVMKPSASTQNAYD